jgi:amino acid transporter
METPPVAHVPDKGLKKDAIGFGSALAIGLDSTAPAYSLAAVIGILVATVGLQAPAVLLVAFVPMFLTSIAYQQLNHADPDCGTTFSWVTRAMGPFPGWVAGFAVTITGILVIGSLADTAAAYTYLLVGWDSAAASKGAVAALTVAYIALMAAVTVLGTQLSARLQQVMVVLQIGALLLFSIVALTKSGGAVDPSLSWLNPFEIPFEALSAGLLTAVFIFWGWESAVTLNEETEDSATAPGSAAVLSTAILLLTYILVAFAVQSWLGASVGEDYNDDIAVLADVGEAVLGSPLDLLVVLAVLVSALASTQTTILPASRSSLSMAVKGAFPDAFAAIHPRYRTPWIGTIAISALATLWYLPLKFASENFLFDTITALGLMIAFYYAITGYASPIFYRRQLGRSARNLLLQGVGPLIGAVVLTYVFVRALIDFADPANSYSGELLGVGPPLVIGVGFLLLGVVLALVWRTTSDGRFFARRPETVETMDRADTVR